MRITHNESYACPPSVGPTVRTVRPPVTRDETKEGAIGTFLSQDMIAPGITFSPQECLDEST